jgi:hypothetical protein
MTTRRWPVLLSAAIAAIAAVLAIVLSPGPASAARVSTAGTRVGASHPGMILNAGVSHPVSAGERRGEPVQQPQFAAGACVAAEDAGSGAARTLFHYTDEAGQKGILDSGQLNPSLRELNPADARYGNGQYLSDIKPGTMTSNQLSRAFLGAPFWGSRFTNFVEIDVSGLNVIEGRAGVYLIPNEGPLDLTGRIVSSGGN